MPESFYPGSTYSSDYERTGNHLRPSPDQEKPVEKNVILTTRESVELFQEAVDTACNEYQRTLNSEAAGETLKPKLTVDLRHGFLSQIPREVIAIIRQDVERLQLSYNQLSFISYDFTQCSALKYLNLRGNKFKEIPKAIFGLPQLEILDLSRNKLSEVPDEIEYMKALRVFSIQHNNIQDLPYCLGSIGTIRMLKVSGNPLNPDLQRIINGNGDSPSPSPALMKDDNERDTILTRKLTEYMRNHAQPRNSGEDSTSDGPLETPRALSRFPVQPQYSHSTSGSESASDLRSPVFPRPSVPARSHFRISSSQNNAIQSAASRRPGLAPLALGNERNRSNSESVLQSTQNNKMKRMGLVTKKHSELGVLDENRANRNSYHFRGQSHGSALRNGVGAGDSSPSGSPNRVEYQRGMIVRRLASLPEQRREAIRKENVIEGTKGVLYSLNMVHPLVSTLASVVKDGKTKRSSIERVFLAATMHIDQLDQELLRFDSLSDQSSGYRQQSKRTVAQAAHDCTESHQQVLTMLTRIGKYITKDADPKYVRTFIFTLCGSMNEISNASRSLVFGHFENKLRKKNIPRVSKINEVSNVGDRMNNSDRSATPTQRRKPERRLRNRSIAQQSFSSTNLQPLGAQTAVPLYANGRSRSNSRAIPFHSSASSSLVNTPRSGESFSSLNLAARSRSGSVNVSSEQIRAEKQETAQFEKIFSILSKSVDEGLGTMSQLQSEFLRALDTAHQEYASPRICDHLARLVDNTGYCLAVTEALKSRLSTVRLNDREARNFRDFWGLAKDFLDSCGNLLVALREGIKQGVVHQDMRHLLKPIHASTREATKLIAISPWNRLTFEVDPQATPQAAPQPQVQIPTQTGYAHRTRGSGGSAAGGTSPYPGNVPATPLSAALGPAAQATVPASLVNTQVTAPPPTPAGTMPATPASASLERSFEGDIFQRAEHYQSLQQTMIPRRHVA